MISQRFKKTLVVLGLTVGIAHGTPLDAAQSRSLTSFDETLKRLQREESADLRSDGFAEETEALIKLRTLYPLLKGKDIWNTPEEEYIKNVSELEKALECIRQTSGNAVALLLLERSDSDDLFRQSILKNLLAVQKNDVVDLPWLCKAVAFSSASNESEKSIVHERNRKWITLPAFQIEIARRADEILLKAIDHEENSMSFLGTDESPSEYLTKRIKNSLRSKNVSADVRKLLWSCLVILSEADKGSLLNIKAEPSAP